MKKILTSILILVGMSAFAQTATRPTGSAFPATVPVSAPATTAATLSPKAKELCKTWLLSKTENFGDQHGPTDAQKKDQLVLNEDGNYQLVKDGAAQSGTWTIDKTNTLITLTSSDGTSMKFKVLESTATTLKIDYRDSDDIHNILYYTTGAGPAQNR